MALLMSITTSIDYIISKPTVLSINSSTTIMTTCVKSMTTVFVLAMFYVCATTAASLASSPRRRVVLLGPHDRFNFGDLLFEKVLRKLLTTQTGYEDSDILSAGMISANMEEYGGNENVIAINKIINMSRIEAKTNGKGPYDIVFTGGESGGCDVSCGASMMMKPEWLKIAKKNYEGIGNCSYAINKTLLLPLDWPKNVVGVVPKPVAIRNSVGGAVQDFCRVPVDFESYRDVEGELLSPDSAVMTRKLYYDVIKKFTLESEVLAVKQAVKGGGYIAVQLNRVTAATSSIDIARMLDEIHHRSNLTTVLFRAGSAPGHDKLRMYFKIKRGMKTPCILFKPAHVWKIVALISESNFVLSTSLHVRIMAFIFHKPRALYCQQACQHQGKHFKFVKLWEVYPFNTTFSDFHILRNFVLNNLHANMGPTDTAVNKITNRYMSMFSKWTNLLNH